MPGDIRLITLENYGSKITDTNGIITVSHGESDIRTKGGSGTAYKILMYS